MQTSAVAFVIIDTSGGEFTQSGKFWETTPDLAAARVYHKRQFADVMCKRLQDTIAKINAKHAAGAVTGWGHRAEKFEVREVHLSIRSN